MDLPKIVDKYVPLQPREPPSSWRPSTGGIVLRFGLYELVSVSSCQMISWVVFYNSAH